MGRILPPGFRLLIGDQAHWYNRAAPTIRPSQAVVIIWLNAHSIPGVIDQMQPLLGPHTRIVTAVNGISYWYFYKRGGAYEGTTLESIDPGGQQWRELGPERAIGCIVNRRPKSSHLA